jgi:hypothetical protein
VYISIPLKDIVSLDTVPAKRLTPEGIQIGLPNNKLHTFTIQLHRKKAYQSIVFLTNAAKNRLIKGAENSLSASSELFAKAGRETTGDLAVNLAVKGASLLAGRSRDDLEMTSPGSQFMDDMDEQDFTDQRQEIESRNTPTLSNPLTTKNVKEDERHPPIHRGAQLKAGLVHSSNELFSQTKNLEFRTVFRLPLEESIVAEESGCSFHKGGSAYSGALYFTQSYMCFTSNPSGSKEDNSFSQIYECNYDPVVLFTIPYAHIVSIKKQPPTALPLSGALTSFSLSGYLVISSKNKVEIWISFASIKSRDKVSDDLFQKIKSVDWKFDDDIMIGMRNGGEMMRRRTSSRSLTDVFVEDPAPSGILQAGLKYQFPWGEINGQGNPDAEKVWEAYFGTAGRDVCMIKEFPALRSLLLQTFGVPDRFRGDFW